MTPRAFEHRAGATARALSVAAAAERALRAAGRRLAGGRAPVGRADLARFARARATGPPPWEARLAAAVEAPGAEGAGPSPILLLAALPWGFRFQRPQQLAVALAAAPGGAVVYVEGFARQRLAPAVSLPVDRQRLQVVRLRIPGRPDPYRRPLAPAAVPVLAERLAAGLTRPPAAVVAQLPFWAPLAAALAARYGVPLVYDRIDLHTGFPGVPAEVADRERGLIEAAALVTATSEALAAEPRRLGVPTLLLPNAVAAADFADPGPPRGDQQAPRAGMVGALDRRIDAAALATAARALPGWELRLAGGVEDPEVAALGGLPNVELAGEIPYPRVPGFLAGLDVALVAYRDLPITRAIDPVKLYEAFAAGLPVVARRLPGLTGWEEPLVRFYDRPEELAPAIEAARATDTPELRRRRREAIAEHTWDRRAAELRREIEGLGGG